VAQPRHPSEARTRQAQALSDRSRNNRDPIVIGKTGPQPFKVTKPTRTRAHGHTTHDESEETRYQSQSQDDGDRYDPRVSASDRRVFQAPGNISKPKYPSKLNQSTKFDTPSEKGARYHAGNTRSSDSGQRIRQRRDPVESEPQIVSADYTPVNYTPTAIGKSTRQRGRIDISTQDSTFEIDDTFDSAGLLLDGMDGDADFDSSPLKHRDAVVLTPPSDRTLALDQRSTKVITKHKLAISDDLPGIGEFENVEDILNEVNGVSSNVHYRN
jgi:hypothetical protein